MFVYSTIDVQVQSVSKSVYQTSGKKSNGVLKYVGTCWGANIILDLCHGINICRSQKEENELHEEVIPKNAFEIAAVLIFYNILDEE